ncbi:MAG TPA: hypothetical protein VI248_05905 [Kineosporiaceae bacterium]
MDVTALAEHLLDTDAGAPGPRLQVLHAVDAVARVALTLPDNPADPAGCLRTGALVSLLHGAGMAAILAAGTSGGHAARMMPVGTSVTVDFRALAEGRLVGECCLDDDDRVALRSLLSGEIERVRLRTLTEVVDSTGLVAGSGTFRWSVRARPEEGATGRPSASAGLHLA